MSYRFRGGVDPVHDPLGAAAAQMGRGWSDTDGLVLIGLGSGDGPLAAIGHPGT